MIEERTDAQREELHARLLALRDRLSEAMGPHADHAKPVELDPAAVGQVSREIEAGR